MGVEIKTTTEADGSFGVVGLQPGTYTVSASHVGFVTKSYADLLLTVNSQLRVIITLVVGNMATDHYRRSHAALTRDRQLFYGQYDIAITS